MPKRNVIDSNRIDEKLESLTDPEFDEIKKFDDELDKIDDFDEFSPEDDDTFDEEVEKKLEQSIKKHNGKNEFWDYEDNKEHWLKQGFEIAKEGEEGTVHEFEYYYVKSEKIIDKK